MFRQNISVYCKTPEIASQVRAFAKKLNETPPQQVENIPEWLMNIMNGGTFPAPEDCTREEAAILYDANINPLVLSFRATRNPDLLKQIEKILESRKI